VAGSNASEHNSSPVWKIWESAGFKGNYLLNYYAVHYTSKVSANYNLILVVKVLPRNATNKEDGVDEFLHAQALNSILKSKSDEDIPGFNTLVLVTGSLTLLGFSISISSVTMNFYDNRHSFPIIPR
jgi:hypothetical protein